MRVEHLKYFEEVANCLNISIAAEKLYISQSTLSHAIKNLEKELGVELIIRKNTGITLTPAGKELLPIIKSISKKSNYLLNYAKFNDKQQQNSLFINVTPQTSLLFSHFIFRPLKAVFPNSSIHVFETFHPPLINNTSRHKADLAFGISNSLSLNFKTQLALKNDIILEPLFNTQMAVIFNKHHPLANTEHIRKEILRNYPLLLMDGFTRPSIGSTKAPHSLSFYDNLDTFPNYFAILDILANDIKSVSIIPYCTAQLLQNTFLSISQLYPLEQNTFTLFALYHKSKTTANPILEKCLELLQNLSLHIAV